MKAKAALASALAFTALAVVSITLFTGAIRVVQVPCSANIANVINNDSKTTATRFALGACTYSTSTTLKPQNGDEVVGPEGTFIDRPPAYDPEPKATIAGSATLDQVMKPQGTVIIQWIRVTGGNFTGQAGTGAGISGGAMSDASSVYAVEVEHNDGAGITNAHGTFDRIELTDNTRDPKALGFIASGLKAVDEVVVKNSYIHETQGSGLWCDEECNDSSAGSFLIDSNLVVHNGRAGIRFEKVGDEANHGQATIQDNEVHGNGWESVKGGVSIRDAQDATVRSNTFGQNAGGIAVIASDSGRSDRPDLKNVTVSDNKLNGEIIKKCGGVVTCTNNTK